MILYSDTLNKPFNISRILILQGFHRLFFKGFKIHHLPNESFEHFTTKVLLIIWSSVTNVSPPWYQRLSSIRPNLNAYKTIFKRGWLPNRKQTFMHRLFSITDMTSGDDEHSMYLKKACVTISNITGVDGGSLGDVSYCDTFLDSSISVVPSSESTVVEGNSIQSNTQLTLTKTIPVFAEWQVKEVVNEVFRYVQEIRIKKLKSY